MRTNPRLRKPSALSTARWTSYAIAVGSTAMSGTPMAEAEIHYSGLINYKFDYDGFQTRSFRLSQEAVPLGFRDARGGNGDSSATFEIKGAAVSNAFREYSSLHSFVVNALPRDSVISQGYFVAFRYGTTVGRLQDYTCYFPGWVEPGTYSIGFRFNNGPGVQYGWVRIKWGGCSGNKKYIVKDYAWGDPGDQIKTGQTRLNEDETHVAPQAATSDDAAPVAASLGSLGLLALGAVGLQTWRKSRTGTGSSAVP